VPSSASLGKVLTSSIPASTDSFSGPRGMPSVGTRSTNVSVLATCSRSRRMRTVIG